MSSILIEFGLLALFLGGLWTWFDWNWVKYSWENESFVWISLFNKFFKIFWCFNRLFQIIQWFSQNWVNNVNSWLKLWIFGIVSDVWGGLGVSLLLQWNESYRPFRRAFSCRLLSDVDHFYWREMRAHPRVLVIQIWDTCPFIHPKAFTSINHPLSLPISVSCHERRGEKISSGDRTPGPGQQKKNFIEKKINSNRLVCS